MRVLVTGGHSRLGGAISEELASAGHAVLIHYRSGRDRAEALASDLSARFGVEVHALGADLGVAGEAERLMARALALGCDALVANASALESDEAGAVDAAIWARAHEIHYAGPMAMAAALARAVEGASVVAISDQSVWEGGVGLPGRFSYSMSKRALAAALPRLALDLAPSRMNVVAPGWTLPTEGVEGEDFDGLHDKTILKRGSRPGDVAKATRFLLEADGITGQALVVDGGARFGLPR